VAGDFGVCGGFTKGGDKKLRPAMHVVCRTFRLFERGLLLSVYSNFQRGLCRWKGLDIVGTPIPDLKS
jgi:hypothetical protein